jgi:hypothetical protein
MNLIDDKIWQALRLTEIDQLFKQLTIPWWIAGGWAIDLFIGKQTREHLDADVIILRKDQFIIKDFLSDWFLYKTNQPGLALWDTREFLELGVNSVWCKKEIQAPWLLEIIFLDSKGSEWFYRREPKIRGLIHDFGKVTKDGIPYISPEIQLLFKAKYNSLVKNELDFNNTINLLTTKQKKWLKEALKIEFPTGHNWINRIESTIKN